VRIKYGFMAVLAVLWFGFSFVATADHLKAPAGEPILTVTGAIAHTTDGSAAIFDLAGFEALGVSKFSTATRWTNGIIEFSGIACKDLVAAVGGRGKEVYATALNDYAAAVPMEIFDSADCLIAARMDGKTMSIRDKGPLWIVFPFDKGAEFNSEVHHSSSVWQLKSLEFRD
jgi:hypothetical protein